MDAWQQEIDVYAAWIAVSVSPGTVRLRRHYLHQLAARQSAPYDVTPDDLVLFLSNPRWSPDARKSARGTLASFYCWASRTGRCHSDLAADLPAIRVPVGLPRPAPREVLTRALSDPDPRTRLMVTLAAYAGLRCAEIAQLRVEDINDGRIRVLGKGREVRSVPIHPSLIRHFDALPSAGYLFPSGDGHLTPGHVSRIVSAALGPHWTAHTLRHSFATSALAATGDLRSVQILMGHASPTTTARYTAVADDRLAEVVRSIA